MDSVSHTSVRVEQPSREPPKFRKRAYARTVKRSRIDSNTLRAMWVLFAAHYDAVSPEQFRADIEEKSHVILLFDRVNHTLCGFSTLSARKHQVSGKSYRVVFSGDTILAPSYRGGYVLSRAFVRFMVGQWLRSPWTPLRWLLISKGYKTYLLLARNYLEYYPTYKSPTPDCAQALLDKVCQDRFKDAYRPQLGIVRFSGPQGKLKPHVAPIGPQELQDPDIAFFVQANPGHRRGDELACLGYFTPWMILHFLRRSLRSKTPRA